ncbi:histidinol-phosphate transaminase [Candidatus Pseudothioglobus singularis]|uniref:Histidinol-phosphate aminotransferase n=1 Tax=Candidatus Pseudothioglobus singularis PS1 TaxID=1125411 RepID=A0A0M4M3N0_9GAMM|nr:histidinol-phosphate transaminase [Candidatus Pseudothioglobus singularis]ALE02367.1 histidinol-phosphate aminotransferase [Candidatus Pseudothioglobus singularis PS1]
MTFIEQWLRSDIKNIDAYHVPVSKDMIKLDAMESPFGVPEDLKVEFLKCIEQSEVNRYPEADPSLLKDTLRSLMDIPDEFGILLGNGSDELIQLLALACSKDDLIMSFEPSFVMYELVSKYVNLEYFGVQLDSNFDINLSDALSTIEREKPKIIFIAYPNNPTGNCFDYDAIIEIIKSTNSMVILDEAYYAYSDKSFLSEISNFPNLLVLRTISKIGFAGLRLGLLIGDQETIAQLNKLRLPYNINALTQTSANFLLQDKQRIINNAQIIIEERRRLAHELSLFSKFKVYPSQTNFILVHSEDAYPLHTALKENGILIKGFPKDSKLSDFIRISVSEPVENNILIDAIRNYYGS